MTVGIRLSLRQSRTLAGGGAIVTGIRCLMLIIPLHMATITLRLRIGTTHLYIRHTRTMRPTHIGTTGLTMLPIERRWAGAGQG